jgi:hypothetical protein
MIGSVERAIVDHTQKYAKLVSKDFACHLLNLVFHLVHHRMTLFDKCHHQCVKAATVYLSLSNGNEMNLQNKVELVQIALMGRKLMAFSQVAHVSSRLEPSSNF